MRVARMTFEKHDIDGTIWTSEMTPMGNFLVKCIGPKKWSATRGALRIGGRDYGSSADAKEACQIYFRNSLEEWLELDDDERGGHDKIARAVQPVASAPSSPPPPKPTR